jgi:bacterioferritin
MKGNEQLISTLNHLLADELTAINQYMVHSEMCANWRFDKLHKAIEGRAIEEMKHAETLIGRILFLEGLPIVSSLNPIHIGADIEKQLHSDLEAEVGAVGAYNDAIRQAVEAKDNGTREILESILGDEENHLDWLEAQVAQIQLLGVQNYLTEQVG